MLELFGTHAEVTLFVKSFIDLFVVFIGSLEDCVVACG